MKPFKSSSSSSAAAAARESVVVAVDANRIKGCMDALDWALNNVVRPGDAVVVLCIISESFPRKKAAFCFPRVYMGMGVTSIWERLEFSVPGDMEPKVLEEEIMKRREEYHQKLQPFYRQCKKNNVQLEMKLAAGFSPKNITIEEAQNNNTRWIVLDSHLKKDMEFIHAKIRCNVATMKGSKVATMLPSEAIGKGDLVKKFTATDTTPVDRYENNVNQEPFKEEVLHPPTSPIVYWCPLSCRPGFPRNITHGELEAITNKFSDQNIACKGDGLQIYQGIHQGTAVLVKCFIENHESFWSELKILRSVRHRNILNLVGYCSTDAAMFLLCDSPCNGSLDTHLQCKLGFVIVDDRARNLSWRKRWDIAMGICSCLRYLHEECPDGPISHLSLHSSNVGLCHNFSPMLTNFTSAKRLGDPSMINAAASFMEEPNKRHLSLDVYAFGLFLLELLTGQALRVDAGDRGEQMVDRALPLLDNGSLIQMMDPRLENSCTTKEVSLMSQAALLCLKKNSAQITLISEVEAVLRGEKCATRQF